MYDATNCPSSLTEEELKAKIASYNDDIKPNFGCFNVMTIFILGLFTGLVNHLMVSFTLYILWGWLIAPFVDYSPSFIFILGSFLVFQVLNIKIDITKKNYKAELSDVFVIFIATVIFCSITLGYGFLWSFFV